MKVAYFDCSFGISGDMTVSALLDAGAPFEELKSYLQTLPIKGYTVIKEEVSRNNFRATHFKVEIDYTEHHHRGLSDVVKIIRESELPDPVKDSSINTFEILAEAEASVHGTDKEKIHFHEVGAVDSIIDIVSSHWCWWKLNIGRGYASEVNVGGGTIESSHGYLPIPAPATSKLLQGFKVKFSKIKDELTTPTGAVLLRSFAKYTECPPSLKIESIGIGAGTKDFPSHPNILRIFIGDQDEEVLTQNDEIYIVEANLDDMSPEMIPPLVELLLSEGAVDVFVTPIICKKGRPGFLLSVMCYYQNLQYLQEIIFSNTTTFGLRYRKEPRIILERSWEDLETPWGMVRVKLGKYQGKIYQASVEFEDAHKIHKIKKVPLIEIYKFVSSYYKNA